MQKFLLKGKVPIGSRPTETARTVSDPDKLYSKRQWPISIQVSCPPLEELTQPHSKLFAVPEHTDYHGLPAMARSRAEHGCICTAFPSRIACVGQGFEFPVVMGRRL